MKFCNRIEHFYLASIHSQTVQAQLPTRHPLKPPCQHTKNQRKLSLNAQGIKPPHIALCSLNQKWKNQGN